MKIARQCKDKVNGTPGSSENINIMNKNLDVDNVPVTEAANKLTAQETTELKNLVSSSRDPQVIASYLAAKSQQESLIEDNNVKNDNLSEASYGGAYDIEDDMYFTKDDLLDFTDELIDTLHDKGIVVDLVNMYMTDGNRLVIAVEDEYGNQIDTDEFIDMRKIRRPKDIYKYKDIFIKNILSQYNELKSFNEDLDEIPVVDRLNFINKRRNGLPGITNINEFIDCLNAVGKDKFMVKETKAGSNLSLADLKDEWMTLKRKGWKWYTKSLPHEFLTYYVFEKTNDKGMQIKENIDEAYNDNDITSYEVASKLAHEFYEYCLKKHVFIEECEGRFDSDDNLVISYEIYNGDWKHEHLATKFLAKEFFFEKGYIVKDVNEDIIDDDGSDTYSAHYDIEFEYNPIIQ